MSLVVLLLKYLTSISKTTRNETRDTHLCDTQQESRGVFGGCIWKHLPAWKIHSSVEGPFCLSHARPYAFQMKNISCLTVGNVCSYNSLLIYRPLPSRLCLKLGKALRNRQNPILIQEAKVSCLSLAIHRSQGRVGAGMHIMPTRGFLHLPSYW